jgi:spermidine synthase
VFAALTMPLALDAVVRVLASAYGDGTPGAWFFVARMAACGIVLTIPAVALGATFPVAVRWFVQNPERAGASAGRLYAANTAGAAAGALAAGFVLLPAVGVHGTTHVGVVFSLASIGVALSLARRHSEAIPASGFVRLSVKLPKRQHRPRRKDAEGTGERVPRWIGISVLALTGLATFIFEIAWTRVSAMVIGPSTYAVAGTLAAFISGLAGGGFFGAAAAGQTRRPAATLAVAISAAAVAAGSASFIVGGPLPRALAQELAGGRPYGELLFWHALQVVGLIVPAAFALGVAFPLALQLVADRELAPARTLGRAYAVNTLAAVAGSLLTGYMFIPWFGLQRTLETGTLVLLAAVAICATVQSQSRFTRAVAVASVAVTLWTFVAGRWDRELLASGAYKYARLVPQELELIQALKAGTLLYYREGAAATVSVKQLAGRRSLAIDGKVDASTGGDMLTQKMLAHVPLLLHPEPSDVLVIGLGSGVTVGSALVHPVGSIDVVEISPEVVEASDHFVNENRHALEDVRTRLIVGDGRSHLKLSSKRYDLIVSEPSNPWMAGVAALFTREFFDLARTRLASGGLMCQWAHTYDISAADLRSIVATFTSAFPQTAAWLVGNGDLLLLGSEQPIEPMLAEVERSWSRPGVAEDLATVSVSDQFSVLSLYAGGREELQKYAGNAPQQTDRLMALEFSGPFALNRDAETNDKTLRELLIPERRPEPISRAFSKPTAAEWRHRAEMLLQADAYLPSFDSYVIAMRGDPADPRLVDGFVRAAVAANKSGEAVEILTTAIAAHPHLATPKVTLSKLLASGGKYEEAIAAIEHSTSERPDSALTEQLASLYVEIGDVSRLAQLVTRLQQRREGSHYYLAALYFLRGQPEQALSAAATALQQDPSHAAAMNLRGAAYASLGEHAAAREAFRAALVLDARDASTYTNLGFLELSTGRAPTAADLFAEALSLDPMSERAKSGLRQAMSQH